MKLAAPSQGFQATSSGSLPVNGDLTVTGQIVAANGTEGAPSISFESDLDTGIFHRTGNVITFSPGGSARQEFQSGLVAFGKDVTLSWGDATAIGSIGAFDVNLSRDAAAVLALKNGTTAQTVRVYGNTTGSKYTTVKHDGTNAFFENSSGNTTLGATGGTITFTHTGTGNLWQIDGGTTYRLKALGSYGFSHGIAALATNATEGFFMLNSCAGVPSGTPASIPTAQCPAVYDSTNNKLYIYNSTGTPAWKSVQLA